MNFALGDIKDMNNTAEVPKLLSSPLTVTQKLVLKIAFQLNDDSSGFHEIPIIAHLEVLIITFPLCFRPLLIT